MELGQVLVPFFRCIQAVREKMKPSQRSANTLSIYLGQGYKRPFGADSLLLWVSYHHPCYQVRHCSNTQQRNIYKTPSQHLQEHCFEFEPVVLVTMSPRPNSKSQPSHPIPSRGPPNVEFGLPGSTSPRRVWHGRFLKSILNLTD